ncbi:hypothetical protein MTsPCn5_19200 [Croceitalea sp. MTPC5]|uniref:hypothetical protein n=1 Tax=Croceitalea sp. MTPC5 TaxID=3056565 RepID=UPI002B3FF860|nr:hypothetical protein MTsPCn5_19200 [Croceitalea sp. MTPC5]
MKISTDIIKVFGLAKEGVSFYLDKRSQLYWSKDGIRLEGIATLPWEYQLPFYLRFLHNDELAERFKKMEILGAIDIFIKNHYFFDQHGTLQTNFVG